MSELVTALFKCPICGVLCVHEEIAENGGVCDACALEASLNDEPFDFNGGDGPDD